MTIKQFGVAYEPASTPLFGTETLSIVQGGVTVDCTTEDIALLAPAGIQSFIVACSDETTALTTGVAKVTFRVPYAFTLLASGIRGSLTTAQASGSTLTVDVNVNGSSILSTKLTIDNTEKTSVTAATQPVISNVSIPDDAEITIDIDQVGASGATGLKVSFIGSTT